MELAARFLMTRIITLILVKLVHHKNLKQWNNQTKLGLAYHGDWIDSYHVRV
jgi:hypothetical protein